MEQTNQLLDIGFTLMFAWLGWVSYCAGKGVIKEPIDTIFCVFFMLAGLFGLVALRLAFDALISGV